MRKANLLGLVAALLPVSLAAQVTVNITWPSPTQNVAHSITLSGTASSKAGPIAAVAASVDGAGYVAVIGTTNWFYQLYGPPVPPPVPGLAAGDHAVKIRATDSAGHTGFADITLHVVTTRPTCSNTQLASGIYCKEAHFVAQTDPTQPGTVTFSGHTAGDTIVVYASPTLQHYPLNANSISNTLGYQWNLFEMHSSGGPDDDLTQAALWTAVVPTTTTAPDTITVAYSDVTNPGNFMLSYSAELSGVGALEQSFGNVVSLGASAVGSTGNYPAAAGDLCFALIGGAPMYPPAGWTELAEDTSRPYGMLVTAPTSKPGCNATFSNSVTDGAGAGGVAFKPLFRAAYTGQSAQIGSNDFHNASIATQPTHRVEAYFHGIDMSGPHYPYDVSLISPGGALGWNVHITVKSATSASLVIHNPWNALPDIPLCNNRKPSVIEVGTLLMQAFRLRLQEDAGKKLQNVEVWDSENNRVYSNSCPYTSAAPSGTGVRVGQAGGRKANVAFFRVHSNVLPMNSHPPTTVDNVNRVFEWKFDGNTNDAAGRYNATPNSTSVSYAATPLTYPIASIRTQDWNALMPVVTQRAGHAILLDGSQSTSQSDASNAITCRWTQSYGPTKVTIADPSACVTSAPNPIFGTYRFRLTVTDDHGVLHTTAADIGVVAMDDKGVVLQSSALADRLYGPMIAWGKNPWLYADDWNQRAVLQRGGFIRNIWNLPPYDGDLHNGHWLDAKSTGVAGGTYMPNIQPEGGDYENLGWIFGGTGIYNSPMWEVTLPISGTVSYWWNGGGWSIGNTTIKTGLTASIASTTQSSIAIAAADSLDLADAATPPWQANHNYSTGAKVHDTYGDLLIAFAGGTSGAKAPAQTAAGAKFGDGTLLWQNLGAAASRILIYSAANPAVNEEVRVCGATATKGAATLTTCYDGRGQTPLAWPATSDTVVTQDKIAGSGSNFISYGFKKQTPLCPLGYGPPGGAIYITGVVDLTPGSTTVTGHGTNWVMSSLSDSGYLPYIRVNATHGGVPFVFWAKIARIAAPSGGKQTMTLQRPYPSTADARPGVHYAIMQATRTVDLRYPSPWVAKGEQPVYSQVLFDTSGCENDEAAYMNTKLSAAACKPGSGVDGPLGCNSASVAHDVPSLNGRQLTGMAWSAVDHTHRFANNGAQGGINFYGEATASDSLCLRSGDMSACRAADIINDYWLAAPFINPDVSGIGARYLFGGAIAAFQGKLVRNRPIAWATLRAAANRASTYAAGYGNTADPKHCTYLSGDTRDIAGEMTSLTLAAEYDPSTKAGDCGYSTTVNGVSGCRGKWIHALNQMYSGDQSCKGTDNSWANTANWSAKFGPLTLTAKSSAGTVASVPPGMCSGTAMGTGRIVTNAGTFTVSTGMIPTPVLTGTPITAVVVTGTRGGVEYSTAFQYTISGSTVTISGLWPGDTGTIRWMAIRIPSGSMSDMIAIGSNAQDYADLATGYGCMQTGSGTFTLSQPWRGASGSAYYASNGYSSTRVTGLVQQPGMLGIKVNQMAALATWNADRALGSLPANYRTLASAAAQWIHDNGIDRSTWSTNYARVISLCEPTIVPNGIFDSRNPGCNAGLAANGLIRGRELNAEVLRAVSYWYQTSPTSGNRTFGDNVYNALWGHLLYNAAGLPAVDQNTVAMNAQTNFEMAGFYCGVGACYMWPAIRLGDVQSAVNRTVELPFMLDGGTKSPWVGLMAPNGLGSLVSRTRVQ